MKQRVLIAVCAIVLAGLLLAEPALAGPGGKIARAVFETFWGKVALAGLTIVFAPIIIYTLVREKLAERRALRDLHFMARHHQLFDWLGVHQRAIDCFTRVHAAWSREDVREAAEWMTEWYWQNQQVAHLARWEREGLRNVCQVRRLRQVRPLLFAHHNNGAEHEGSLLVLSITANLCDYLQARATGVVVEGSKAFKDVTTLWTFVVCDGRWRVANIEEDTLSLMYARYAATLPPVESTLGHSLSA
ncbi:Tim44 domain-containing protein [Tahibacter amnicola]|uniref:Tim44-like domain-containing protein n=1 Tax=Tahibacter amnicola TaxID=2976241 RepID=A0ABY6BI15_9GAMM|nr:Tim44-like domain-containing protein [Tahibacter amnicola]UXI68261.1 Tim44-like domain-containing protein [Tahibacter amnicola]